MGVQALRYLAAPIDGDSEISLGSGGRPHRSELTLTIFRSGRVTQAAIAGLGSDAATLGAGMYHRCRFALRTVHDGAERKQFYSADCGDAKARLAGGVANCVRVVLG